MNEYKIKATCHTYVTLLLGDQFIHCYDNDFTKAEDIIDQIEKRTGKSISEIDIIGSVDDFDGFFWRTKCGWHNLITGK